MSAYATLNHNRLSITDRLQHAVIAFLSTSLLIPGTGGDTSKQNLERLQNPFERHIHTLVPIQEAVKETISINSIEDLNHIVNVLNPNISELAKILHVSRQAIYKWKNGEGISDESAQKLHDLARAADVFVKAGIEVNPFMLRRTVSGGQSFLEIIEQGGSAVEAAKTLVQIVEIGQRERALLDQHLANRPRKTGSIIDDFPVSYQDDY
jgi:transcriptional regulator with XRE-family HTH domain